MKPRLLSLFVLLGWNVLLVCAEEPVEVSGIYPHLAYFNNEGECGTGAVVPWAGRLWVVTYAPHAPKGSSDRLYEITDDLKMTVRPESIGGTPANRMIHRESQQLFIGPHVIDAKGGVRTISYQEMPGRPTGNARHLTDPAGKIYYATMEEGIYEVDVKTLAVKELFADDQTQIGAGRGTRVLEGRRYAGMPGYHGKGLYSGHGRLIYANNGEAGREAMVNPTTPSGALASWTGGDADWEMVLRNQFTEVTGPGGIYGNEDPAKDPIWAMGWDHRSLILMLLDGGKWHRFRLPKGSHSYDGAHGWNTEWPRIREIGQGGRLLGTMHGTFWSFPKTFSAKNSAGIAPRSNYLKVVGDFAMWNGRLVLGCDDTAKSEFLNKRKAKGEIAAPQSQSNLWFVEPGKVDALGPVIGRGAVWMDEAVAAGVASDAYLFSGYERKGLHVSHGSGGKPVLTLEVDVSGNGTWTKLREVTLDTESEWIDLTGLEGVWVRLVSRVPLVGATAVFHFSNKDSRSEGMDGKFAGLAKAGDVKVSGGLVRARDGNKRTLAFAAMGPGGEAIGCYELDERLELKPTADDSLLAHTLGHAKIPMGVLKTDAASVVFTDDAGKRWRLPKGDAALDEAGPLGDSRVCREVATERDLFHAHGTFYELPAENAGGFIKVRPVATHNLRIHDYCSYRGMLILTGVADDAPKDNRHIIRSADGKAVLWAGVVDDLWSMGKPRGTGGPWAKSAVKAGEPSDPYLATGYDRKVLKLSHEGTGVMKVRVEADFTGTGAWRKVTTVEVAAGETVEHVFPPEFAAYWFRLVAETDGVATGVFEYD